MDMLEGIITLERRKARRCKLLVVADSNNYNRAEMLEVDIYNTLELISGIATGTVNASFPSFQFKTTSPLALYNYKSCCKRYGALQDVPFKVPTTTPDMPSYEDHVFPKTELNRIREGCLSIS